MAKQAHLILNVLNQMPNPMNMVSKLMFENGRAVQDWMANIIYPDRFLPIWDTEKAKHTVFRDWHQWFWNDSNSDFFQTWKRHMDHLNQTVPKKWMQKDNIYDGGYKSSWSKGYLIGKIQHDTTL
jgi:hypothetical protein